MIDPLLDEGKEVVTDSMTSRRNHSPPHLKNYEPEASYKLKHQNTTIANNNNNNLAIFDALYKTVIACSYELPSFESRYESAERNKNASISTAVQSPRHLRPIHQ